MILRHGVRDTAKAPQREGLLGDHKDGQTPLLAQVCATLH
jgi:hypothetical protein